MRMWNGAERQQYSVEKWPVGIMWVPSQGEHVTQRNSNNTRPEASKSEVIHNLAEYAESVQE